MSIIDILKLPQLKENLGIGSIILVVILSLVQVSKIPWNPWSAILKWIGNRLNADLTTRMSELETKLDEHIQAEEKKELMDMRRDILDFCNACMNKRKHTKEQFKFVLKECDSYEKYIDENKMHNGEIAAAIAEIKRLYAKCIQENSFLKEGE